MWFTNHFDISIIVFEISVFEISKFNCRYILSKRFIAFFGASFWLWRYLALQKKKYMLRQVVFFISNARLCYNFHTVPATYFFTILSCLILSCTVYQSYCIVRIYNLLPCVNPSILSCVNLIRFIYCSILTVFPFIRSR